MTLHYNTRRQPRRRPRRKKRLITLALLIIALAAIAVYYISTFPKQVPKINYPMTYSSEIRAYSEQYGLDPARVAAVIYCESSFNPDALSPVGARGLMQIMPTTAEWLKNKCPEIDYTGPDMLYYPDVSLSFGCWYLNYLDGRFNGDLPTATAAYHTGQGHVDEWLAESEYSTDGLRLTSIPSEVTDTYVKKVALVYESYKELYQEETNS